MTTQGAHIAIVTSDGFESLCRTLSNSLGLRCISSAEVDDSGAQFLLKYTDEGLQLSECIAQNGKPTSVDWMNSTLLKRSKDSLRQQNLLKSIGVKKNPNPKVLDAMAGLGNDGFLMSCAGCSVHMLERSGVIHALLQDGLSRSKSEIAHMGIDFTLAPTAKEFLDFDAKQNEFDVVYLDPMYPEGERKSKAKKDMSRLHLLLGNENDEERLLEKALNIATRRVSVKRPKHAADFALRKPDIVFKGSSARFDVYLVK